jgi:hypothetical protein
MIDSRGPQNAEPKYATIEMLRLSIIWRQWQQFTTNALRYSSLVLTANTAGIAIAKHRARPYRVVAGKISDRLLERDGDVAGGAKHK